ncbi:1002_t:CDS:2, partial [Gigaspora margarita]
KVSEMCSKKLPTYIAKNLSCDLFCNKTNISIKNGIKKGFEKTDQYLKLEQFSKESKDAGSTALIAVMILLKDKIIAYVRDSLAFISSNGLSAKITKEHNLHNKSEVLRKWHDDATKNAEDSKVWINLKTIDEKDLSDISEQDCMK